MKKLECNNIRLVNKRQSEGRRIRRKKNGCPYNEGWSGKSKSLITTYPINGIGCQCCKHYIGKLPNENFIFCDGDEKANNSISNKYLLTEKKYEKKYNNGNIIVETQEI